MSELQIIEDVLLRTERRRRRERAFRGLWQGMVIGAAVWCAAVMVHLVFPTPTWTLPVAGGLGLAAMLAGAIAGGWRRQSVGQTARWVDSRRHLQERLSTALEVARADRSESWRELLVGDAVNHAKQLDPRQLVKFKLPRVSRWAFLLLALGIGLLFVPVYRTHAYAEKQKETKVIKEVGRQLVELTKHSLSNRPPALEATEKSMEAVSDLGDQFNKRAVTKDQALKDLTKMSDRLKDELKDLTKDPALRRMEQAARSEATSPEAEQLQKQIDEAAKKLGDSTATAEQMEKLNTDLGKLEASAKAEMEKNGELSQSTKDDMSKSLDALSKQAQELGMNMPNLDQAMQALAASQNSMFIKDIQQSTEDLQKMQELAKSLQQLQKQQAEQIGKDLAQQLQNGQPEAAQATLQKMMDQLKSGALTQDQLNKIMSEVANAADPGSKYGKAGDYLKQAASQMGQGDKPGAAGSLAAASKELDTVMQQMGDAKSLLAELDALNKASIGVGDCNSWSLGKSNGKAGLSTKMNHRPGRGVGTWEDEESGWGYNGEQTGLWDNTGVTRPDQAPKGLTDRDAELSDALKPTQVKGTFSPGGPMPSITLKGVSIAGKSQVAYTAEVEAAQTDAQSALSQDKVPRAYRDTVHDYFDDLKK